MADNIADLKQEFDSLAKEARAFFEEAARETIQRIGDGSWFNLSDEQSSRAKRHSASHPLLGLAPSNGNSGVAVAGQARLPEIRSPWLRDGRCTLLSTVPQDRPIRPRPTARCALDFRG